MLEHLESCEVCAKKLNALPEQETLAGLIRQAETVEDRSSEGTIVRLVERLSKLRPGEVARSWYRFESVLRDLTGMPHFLPTHQGRASERILFELVGGPGHIDYVIEATVEVFRRRQELRGLRITEAPAVLRHFTAKFAEM